MANDSRWIEISLHLDVKEDCDGCKEMRKRRRSVGHREMDRERDEMRDRGMRDRKIEVDIV